MAWGSAARVLKCMALSGNNTLATDIVMVAGGRDRDSLSYYQATNVKAASHGM